MKLRSLLGIFSLLLLKTATAQSVKGYCENEAFNNKVDKVLSHTVDVISVKELHENLDTYTLLDTRELNEYLISHIPGAIHLGYDHPKYETLDTLSKDTEIVVYCSIGYRSEKIGEKLKEQGFTKVKNLYGSIFEWANQDYLLEDPMNHPTEQVHTYNKRWSKWVDNEKVEKVY